MRPEPHFIATGLGSMPFTDPDHAVDISLSHFPDAPYWPQLPRLGYRELMGPQYAEGLPCVQFDDENERVWFDTAGDCSMALAEFYEHYLQACDPDFGTGDCSALAIGPEFSRGIGAFEKRLQSEGVRRPFIKVHATGPCTFALSLPDGDKRAIYYNPEFRDVAVKALGMKCRWQIEKFKPWAQRVICFIDEPVLSAYGSSAYVGVLREDVVALLGETVEAIHAAGALAGVHCCGNTEWTLLTDAGADIISFDAFDFGDTIAMYPKAIARHIEHGGLLAWGIVPTNAEKIREQTPGTLIDKLEGLMDALASKGIDRDALARQAFVTPACGTGSVDLETAQRVFDTTSELSALLREQYVIE